MALSKAIVDRLKYAPGAAEVVWDSKISGFGVRVYPSGRKAYFIRYRIRGVKKLFTLGACNVLTVDQARKLARQKLSEADHGKDPLAARKKEKQGETFKALCERYIEEHAKPHKKTWAQDERRIERHFKKWEGKKPEAITRVDVARVHTSIGATAPYEANRTLALAHKIFELAEDWGFVAEGWPNPAGKVKKFGEQKRKRFARESEVSRIAKAIDAEPNIYVRAALWLYLLTGARKSELLSARRSAVDIKEKILNLPETKAGEHQLLSLNKPAIAIIKGLPAEEGNPYLFPGKRKGKPLVNISKPWDRVRKAAGVEDLRLHDLRRTVGSWMAQSDVSLTTIKDALRHSDINTTLTYARLGEDAARKPFEDHGRQVMNAVKEKSIPRKKRKAK